MNHQPTCSYYQIYVMKYRRVLNHWLHAIKATESMIYIINNIHIANAQYRSIHASMQLVMSEFVACQPHSHNSTRRHCTSEFSILTHWPLGDLNVILKNVIFNLALLIGILKSSYDNVLRWMSQDLTDDVNIGSGNGLVPSGNTPLPEPVLTKISNAIWRH